MNSIERARELRKKSTWVERSLWRALRNRRFAEYKFRRQFPCGVYYLDFYCPEALLDLELDGGGHGFPAQQAHDQTRDEFLASQGILVKRIWNSQWKQDRRAVLHNIWLILQERAPHPNNQVPGKGGNWGKDAPRAAKAQIHPPRPSAVPSPRLRGEG